VRGAEGLENVMLGMLSFVWVCRCVLGGVVSGELWPRPDALKIA
jgi:hypothetical protein